MPSDLNPTFTVGNRMVTEIYEPNVWHSQREISTLLTQINAPLLTYRLILYIIILPYFHMREPIVEWKQRGSNF
ncbi:MAG TPA: hypothetical protein VK566_04305 [Nitrososphaeraceae archaeon]|nr:hypothetical protein [Nitrososphaeraceae archaeon]